ncbi:MAG: tripartite tricarboxylate transporter substrate binding protein [Betaproteobacteria bacterium]|nr:tripartite tricarboxylate transporter substrate binding protein [Betaproteobacteria bacterium]
MRCRKAIDVIRVRLRSSAIRSISIFVVLSSAAHPALGQQYPAKPIKVIVGFAVGGAADVTARMLQPKLNALLGQPVIIDNRLGSGGAIATEFVAKSAPDGYTLLLMPAADAVQPAVRRKLPYDLDRDLAPVGRIVLGPWVVVVNPSVPVRTAQELIALAKANPGKLNYASSGIGSSAHITAELFSSMAHVKLVHIPYKGVSDGVTATAIGQSDMIFASYPAAQPLLQVNKVRPLAVSIAKRWIIMPDIPTLDEAGLKGFDRSGWYGMLVPAGTPREIVTRLNAAIVSIVNTADMTDALRKQGLEPSTSTAEDFGAFIRNEVAQNIRIAKSAAINVE